MNRRGVVRFCGGVVMILLAACSEDSPVNPPSLGHQDTLYVNATFPIGAAIDPGRMRGSKSYKDVVFREFNSITAENAMKLGWLHPAKDTYSFGDADYLISLAEANQQRVHGHTLVWHSFGDVTWIKNFSGDSTAWENMMKAHIETVLTHFKGKVVSWDVVNEAFNDEGQLRDEDPTPANGQEDGSVWARKLGTDYIARAFQYAHAADPEALLFYNDYGQEYSASKLQAIVNMVEDFKVRGIPIHGIGLQMHIGINSDEGGIRTALEELAATGLLIHISELDVNISGFVKNPALTFSGEASEKQKAKYKFVAQTYKEKVPDAQRFGITTWNVGDADSWLRPFIQANEWPCLFDDAYKPKPAYYGFLEGLNN